MKKTKKVIVLLVGLLTACTGPTNDSAVSNEVMPISGKALVIDKLIGLWKNEDGKNFERWVKKPDGSYRSDGFHTEANDTVFTERVEIHKVNGEWTSENTVFDQNNGASITFTITDLNENELHFNNPKHDFPTDIHYQLTDENSIHAFIAGPNQSGGRDTIPFNFSRVTNH